MATPTPDNVSIYYASKGLPASGTPTVRTIHSVTNAMVFRVSNISEETGFWDGAVGYFTNTSTAALRGKTFHVRFWSKETDSLTLAAPLPTQPVTGDTFVLFVGGKQASDREVLCMLAGGKQPELETVAGSTVTGVTIKKISPLLGIGTLTLYYTYTSSTGERKLQIRMGTSGDYGPAVDLTGNATDLVVSAKDLLGYIIVDVEFSKLSTSSTRTDTFTVTMPKGNMLPNYEGYPTRMTYGINPFPKNSPSHCKMETFLPPYGWVSFDVSETQKLLKKIAGADNLDEKAKQELSERAKKRLISGFRDNTWFIQTRGSDYELEPPAAKRAAVVRTIYAEADGVALPEPDPANRNQKGWAWMTVHKYTADRDVTYPFSDLNSLKEETEKK